MPSTPSQNTVSQLDRHRNVRIHEQRPGAIAITTLPQPVPRVETRPQGNRTLGTGQQLLGFVPETTIHAIPTAAGHVFLERLNSAGGRDVDVTHPAVHRVRSGSGQTEGWTIVLPTDGESERWRRDARSRERSRERERE
ncbi:hypothetical protein MBM_05444 [Drepanopeziza brunnea f. sp. 'multigermtubi' MB_m1]|uniref:Uncharacterized protein n=1 Tax=Marssonina brunnea f. sp. multigermtubi (strain MB_m1) TaxID=1072389 RepID=K1WFG0_MARBU|nr:uncharacterized protein MBM_05444 [Drepanopeziza brunnea f. sp. 'multigermtubi' MB_m1]EKD16150.1 hypothetical protein MBM_05444 [Drepanopeziza brunnea f. sp. 'multigermtubi' MB_m1]